jgi:large subunit ribosomal protein L4
MKIQVLDQKGNPAEEIIVEDCVFNTAVNTYLIHSVAVALANNRRQGTKSALTRSEVRGHSKKPYRQKGTGNARQGSTKAPQFDGGGVAFAPKPRDFSTKINKKQKSGAFVSALSGKLADKEFIVINDTYIEEPKTKKVARIIEALKLDERKVLFVTGAYDEVFLRAVENIPNASVTTAAQLSVLDIVTNKYIVASVDAVRSVEAQYKEGA